MEAGPFRCLASRKLLQKSALSLVSVSLYSCQINQVSKNYFFDVKFWPSRCLRFSAVDCAVNFVVGAQAPGKIEPIKGVDMSKFLTIVFDKRERFPVEGASIDGMKIAGIFRSIEDMTGPDPDNDVDSIVAWKSLDDNEKIIAQYNSAVLSRGEDHARFELRKLEIDDQGYDEIGRYWGRPSNVWQLSDTDSFDFDKFFRADSASHALAIAENEHGVDIDDILVIIPGASDNDFTI